MVVALVTQNTSLITVIGEVNNDITSTTGRIPAQPAGERLLDVITRAGGLRDQGQDMWVVLERHGHRASVPFGSLVYEPGNNIWAWPGDTIYLYKEPQTFLAFGASGQQGQFQFSAGSQSSAWRMTLAEGVAAAGGLIDVQADPGSVFLYRREPRELAEKLGVDCSKMDGPTVPVVYSVSFADPAGYFLATTHADAQQGRHLRRQRAVGRDHEVRDIPQHAAQRSEQRRGDWHQLRGLADRQPYPLSERGWT